MVGSGYHVGEWDDNTSGIGSGITGSGPLAIYSQSLSRTVVISSYSNFMAHSQYFRDHALSYGIMGSVERVPDGYVIETVMLASSGVNLAFEAWGDLLLARYGKQRYGYRNDFILRTLGYSTDNGA